LYGNIARSAFPRPALNGPLKPTNSQTSLSLTTFMKNGGMVSTSSMRAKRWPSMVTKPYEAPTSWSHSLDEPASSPMPVIYAAPSMMPGSSWQPITFEMLRSVQRGRLTQMDD